MSVKHPLIPNGVELGLEKESLLENDPLLEIQENYAQLYQNMFDPAFFYNFKEDIILDCNQAALDLLECSDKTELIGKNQREFIPQYSDYFPGQDVHEMMLHQRNLVLQGQRVSTSTPLITKKQNELIAQVNLIPIKKNSPLAFIILKDKTKYIQTKKELELSRQRYKNMVHSSPSGISIFDTNFDHLYASPRSAEIFNLTDNKRGLSIFNYFPEREHQKIRDVFKKALESDGKTIKTQMAGLTGKNKELFVEGFVRSNGGKEVCLVFNDITERIKAQKELEERKAIYELLVTNSFTGIDIIELETKEDQYLSGKLIIRNSKMEYFLNESERPMLFPEEFKDITPEVQPNGTPSEVFFKENTSIVLNNQSLKYDWRLVHPDGKIIDLEVVNHIIEVSNKKILIRIYDEVTERIQQQAIIEQQVKDLSTKNQELRKYIESNGELENFAYIASHDLQAPLRTISSFTGLLKRKIDDRINAEEQDYMNFIIDATKNMQLLIRDLLTYSRVNSNKSQYKPLNLNEVLEDVVLQLSTTIQEKQAMVEIGSIPSSIQVDKVKMRQLFQNLITNALKFTKEGVPPIIKVFCEEKPNEWKFFIQDNGIGIAPEYQEKIFLLFRRLHTTDTYEGTGIGLAMCKKIVEQHQGTIGISSELGKGSTFYFTIRKDLLKQQEYEAE